MLGWFFPSKGELLHPRYLPKNRISLQPINKNGIRESVTTIFGICIYEENPPTLRGLQCIDLFLVFQMYSFFTNRNKAYVLNPFSTNRRKAFIFDISVCLLEMKDQ